MLFLLAQARILPNSCLPCFVILYPRSKTVILMLASELRVQGIHVCVDSENIGLELPVIINSSNEHSGKDTIRLIALCGGISHVYLLSVKYLGLFEST